VQRDSEGILPLTALLTTRVPWDTDQWTVDQVVSLLEPMVVGPRQARILEVLARRLASVVVMMDAPHDPHNGAAVLRSCDAFGVQEVHVVPREEPFQVAGGVAKGTERWVDVVQHPDPQAAIRALQERGFEFVATHPAGDLLPSDLAAIPRLALILGNEHDGICARLQAAARRSVRIPMRGFVESLNVSVSAAVLLAAATEGRAGDLSPDQRRLLYARGLYLSVARAGEILAAAAGKQR
jgi:tRNA (guanosine-2'-O-)-methyltransferase